MVLEKVFERFARYSPVTVMMRGIMEYTLPPERLDELFREHAERQYEDELLFSTVVDTLALAVNGVRKSVNSAYLASREDFTVSVTALYDKLQGVETPVSQAIVRESAARLRPVVQALGLQAASLLKGYRVKILDGNHLTGTDHRLTETRRLHSSPLPGQALVVLDPQLRLLIDVFPCEDAYSQERSLLGEVLTTVEALDLWLADRNFCTTGFLFSVRDQLAFFLIRQHGSTLCGKKLLDSKREMGRCEKGLVYEQMMEIRNPAQSDPERQIMLVRRITIVLDEPTTDGETEIHLVTNVAQEHADAITLAQMYRQRWNIESAFQEVEQALRSEVNTLCYPKAALLAFCVALLTYNVLSAMKTAMHCGHRDPSLLKDLSGYYLAEEISATYRGMMIAIEPCHWTNAFSQLTAQELAELLKQLAKNVDVSRYKKNKRGPKKPPPKRTGGLREKHVSTARLIDQRSDQNKKVTA
jgi:IS4 transposase